MRRLKEIYYSNPKYAEFLRFCVVGGFSTCLDAAIFYIVRLFASYQVALVSGYCLSLLINYLLTVYWTFKEKPNAGNLFGIAAAHLFNLFIVRISLMFVFVDLCKIDDRIAYIPTVFISVITNFLIVRFAVKKAR